jgi:ribosomal protein S18 acetylase RimI-like enzyme
MNSVGNLLLHLAGDLTQRFGSVIGGEPDVRDRFGEFTERKPIPKDDLLRQFEDAAWHAEDILSGLTPARLVETCRYELLSGTTEKTVLGVVLQTLTHLSGHAQEILHGRAATARGWPVIITTASPEDADAILVLQRLAYRSEAELYGDDTLPPLTETLDQLRAEFGHRLILKAVDNGLIVGSVRAHQEGDTCHIGRLIVHPDRQGQGIGTALMHEVEARFPVARRFELFTGTLSVRNLRLYERLGYVAFKEQVVSDKVTLVYLEKRVARS